MPMADRISVLPSEVLCHILSFLPTEDVVATTVISKRWRSLWLLVPTLDFDYQRYISSNNNRSQSSFVRFVYATILGGSCFPQPIKTFHLICDSSISDTTIWLNAAMQQRQVQNLEIEFRSKQHRVPGTIPFSIFSSTTLVVLKLHSVRFRAFPSSVDLPSLKALHLSNVAFKKAQLFFELLHGCPILENLEANGVLCFFCTFEEDRLISLPKLVGADLSDMINLPIAMKVFSNVEFLRLEKVCMERNLVCYFFFL
ncbi:F-box/FBD/LRR-repeat protein At4g26340-like [Lotus japonicus]|uniref:F-box/FBD/LRR-repeat protein At4g26340-like n=1 Tax=Lotus japonicus TaxID=34305 RepID=UPI00258F1191|nr:F-box/FBD/LRR-repeat protein At4g26340-like [Lotus japonicus]